MEESPEDDHHDPDKARADKQDKKDQQAKGKIGEEADRFGKTLQGKSPEKRKKAGNSEDELENSVVQGRSLWKKLAGIFVSLIYSRFYGKMPAQPEDTNPARKSWAELD